MKHSFFNIGLDVLSREEALQNCQKFLGDTTCRTLFFLNAHCFNLAQTDEAYAQALNDADLLLNDGIGVKLASLAAGVQLQDNLNGTDLIPQILHVAAKLGTPVYLLGGREGVASLAAQAAAASLPEIKIVGARSGYFTVDEEPQVVEAINRTGAELVVLGMGVPRQELWASQHADELTHARLVISGWQ